MTLVVLHASKQAAGSFSRMAMELKVGYVCDRGLNPKRPVNQDRFLSVPERGLFAVFDGVGGQRAGEVASQTAAETIEEAVAAHASAGSSVDLVSRAIQFANRDIFEMAESDEAYKTMATTVALVHVAGDRATIAHVGDSRVYRLEDGRFHRETIDHTDFNDAILGVLGRDHISAQGRSNVINRALGVDREVEVDVKQIHLHDGARFLLCSDGIYRHLSDEEIARVLAENKDPQMAADELKRLVHERGADDNLTAVVVQAGRARVRPVLALDPATPNKKKSPRDAPATAGAASAIPERRIRVEFGEPRVQKPPAESERGSIHEASSSEENGQRLSASRVLIYLLAALVLLAGGFYAGLRASEWQNSAAEPGAGEQRELVLGKEAFERGDYLTAVNQFESLAKREPQNAVAFYWLGRGRLEQRDYAGAAKEFELAISHEPKMFDAYLQAAAAYQLLGEKAKATEMLIRHSDERRKAEQR